MSRTWWAVVVNGHMSHLELTGSGENQEFTSDIDAHPDWCARNDEFGGDCVKSDCLSDHWHFHLMVTWQGDFCADSAACNYSHQFLKQCYSLIHTVAKTGNASVWIDQSLLTRSLAYTGIFTFRSMVLLLLSSFLY